MTVPVTVVVPHQKTRGWFFQDFCLPSIVANDPAQVVIEDWEGGACEKRNAGAKKALAPYVVFVDDDQVLGKGMLAALVGALEADPKPGYAYCDFIGVLWPGMSMPGLSATFPGGTTAFNPDLLKKRNFIDTTAVIRTPLFPGFDEGIRRYQDWDLWLTMLGRGIHGRHVPGVRFMKFFFDKGISANVPEGPAREAIRRKHRL